MKTESSLPNWLLLGGVCLFLVIIGECLTRWIPVSDNIGPLWRYHRILGWTQIPQANFSMAKDGRNWQVEFNKLGFRDTEHQTKKPQGIKRVLFVGDSIGEAAQVNLDETYFKILEHRLNQDSPQKKWETINLSVGDFGSAQELLALRNYGVTYSPDYLVLEIFPLNDLCNNLYEAYGLCKSYNDYYRPYMVQTNDQLTMAYHRPWLNTLRKNSSLFGFIERLIRSFQWGGGSDYRLQSLKHQQYSSSDPLFFGYFPNVNQSPIATKAWNITERIFEEFIKEAQSRNMTLLVLVIPFESSVNEDSWSKYTEDKSLTGAQRDYPERRIEDFFGKYGVPIVSPLKEFANHRISELYIDGHLSPKAHRIVADLLNQKLMTSGHSFPKAD